MTRTILDDLVFMPAPLDHRALLHRPELSQQFPVGSQQKQFQQAVPLFARHPPISSTDAGWAAYCGLLKDMGIPLQTTATSLEQLSIANVPIRMSRRACDTGFDFADLETADVIEISCIDPRAGHQLARLPLEIAAWHELKQLVEAVRELAGPSTPVGLSMLTGDVFNDVANAIATRADFVVLQHTSSSTAEPAGPEIDFLAWSIVAARSAAAQSGAPHFPIFVDARVNNHGHLIKLLALGASAVSIDLIASQTMPLAPAPVSNLPKGLLSGIGTVPPRPVPSMETLQRNLTQLLEGVQFRLQQQHLGNLRDLNRDHLRALSERAARLCHLRVLD